MHYASFAKVVWTALYVWGCLHTPSEASEDFAQLDSLLPAPNEARLASGAPGPAYWQQEANYIIDVELDEANGRLIGRETVEYVNHSPHTLRYLWLQLDQNAMAQGSKRLLSQTALPFEGKPGQPAEVGFDPFRLFVYEQGFEGGYQLTEVTEASGQSLSHTVAGTNMRIDLPKPLGPGQRFIFKIGWEFKIMDEALAFRHGRIQLKGGDYAYHVAQWYPRMCAYYDQQGWQLKPYIGSGEFALEFGAFEVRITVPEDFVVAATGELANPDEILDEKMRKRLRDARESAQPLLIVTPEEAKANLAEKAAGKKTWIFKAERVRDFAFAASRGYIWDAKGVTLNGRTVMAMSIYPPEAAALWQRYSTETVGQALRAYSSLVYPYPYPVAWSAWGPEGGMEYPMISFQSSWNIDDKETYPIEHRNYVILVIIHEVGHNWFPMVVNNDERQWMWMDEGLNSFVEHLAATQFDPVIQKQYREAVRGTIQTMAQPDDPVIMTAADSMTQRHYQAYNKPDLALMVLREGVLGRDLFDFAFQEYARRWAFKRPAPADFFRTMEDASGVDLDWFWRGWFFGNDHVDMAIESVAFYRLDDGHPARSKALDQQEAEEIPRTPYEMFLKELEPVASKHPHLQDWYFRYNEFAATAKELKEYEEKLEKLEKWQREQLSFEKLAYVVRIKNHGGLVMPLVLDIAFEDGSERRLRIPVEIWAKGEDLVKVPLIASKRVAKVELDRDNALADADLSNNVFPREIERGRFKLKPQEKSPNPMREALFPKEEK